MDELKKCRFSPCKGKGQLVSEFVPGEFYVYCLNCGRHTEVKKTKAEAIAAWNRRASEWTRVDDGLPKKTDWIFVRSGKNVPETMYYRINSEGCLVKIKTYTHWQEITLPGVKT